MKNSKQGLSLNRRRFLQAGGAALAAGTIGLGADAIVFEPNDPRVVEVEIALPGLPEAFYGLTIAQLSDFHYSDLCAIPVRKSVEILKRFRPDLVALTGDFITVPLFARSLAEHKTAAATAEPCARVLSELRPGMGMFAVLGNHDRESDHRWISETLESFRIPVLKNRCVAVEKDNARVWFAGVDDVLVGEPDLEAACRDVPAGETIILLAHEPDFADTAARFPISLQLSGHSHGGQVWLPGIGAPWLPPLGRRYPRGLRKVGGLTLYTNIGLGTIRLPIRLNCPPEITLIRLTSA